MRYKVRPRGPMRNNSRNLSVRMTEEQYQQLCRYLALTGLPVTTYFRKLIRGERIRARLSRFGLNPHPGVNHIYSNVRQIARNPRARELAPEAVRQLEFLADLLCGESDRLTQQE